MMMKRISNVNEGMVLFTFQGSISSMLMVVLAAKDGEDVLELCATNSGKTPHIGIYFSVEC